MLNIHIIRKDLKTPAEKGPAAPVSKLFIKSLFSREKVSLCVLKILDDGCCFFHAIASSLVPSLSTLYNDTWLAITIRTNFVEYLNLGPVRKLILLDEITLRTEIEHEKEC